MLLLCCCYAVAMLLLCCCYSLNPRPEEEEEEKGPGFNHSLARSFLLLLFRPENKAMLPSGLVSRLLHPAQILRMCHE